MARPLIIQYLNLLHKYGPDTNKTKIFVEKHSNDEKFVERSKKLDKLFRMKINFMSNTNIILTKG